jgi:hypothetical protein
LTEKIYQNQVSDFRPIESNLMEKLSFPSRGDFRELKMRYEKNVSEVLFLEPLIPLPGSSLWRRTFGKALAKNWTDNCFEVTVVDDRPDLQI